MALLAELWIAFTLGLLTPLTAVCILPLYPGFLAYLSHKFSGVQGENKKLFIIFGSLVTLGVILFMLLLGLIFTTFFQVSLTNVIGIVSPIAFGILLIISILLIINFDFSNIIPKATTPVIENPWISALSYGFFFGAIVIPCNPAFIAAFFTRAVLVSDPTTNILSFISFGLGIGAPLLIFSLISAAYSIKAISFLTRHKKAINLITGIIMFVISLYYLLCNFTVLGDYSFIKAVCIPLDKIFGIFVQII